MGECLISRRGGESYELPVLNASYPQDVTIIENSSGSATFQIVIATPGKPAEYTYQWYVNGSAVSGATSMTYTKSGLTTAATYTVYCEVTNKAGIVTSRIATLRVQDANPVYSFDGSSQFIQDSAYNWRIKFYSSGNLRFSSLGNAANGIQIFCVGGGGAGGSASSSSADACGGGGGGKTNTFNATPAVNTTYWVQVGGGGSPATGTGGSGGTSSISALGASAGGGSGGYALNGGAGGSGGGGTGYWITGYGGGSNGSNGLVERGGKGQNYTTREFGESSGLIYSGGGGGGSTHTEDRTYTRAPGGDETGGAGGLHSPIEATTFNWPGIAGATNRGGGGGGCGSWGELRYDWGGGAGGSGIVIIRNRR